MKNIELNDRALEQFNGGQVLIWGDYIAITDADGKIIARFPNTEQGLRDAMEFARRYGIGLV